MVNELSIGSTFSRLHQRWRKRKEAPITYARTSQSLGSRNEAKVANIHYLCASLYPTAWSKLSEKAGSPASSFHRPPPPPPLLRLPLAIDWCRLGKARFLGSCQRPLVKRF